ncbi:hypothetical protein HPB50_010785 [Hyalomma asiaticum]|uniref:Uncharacterized protein n=1 Tax=Hyalomma asiaticum TaxID=266040 RepID=A0ACB7T6Z5_HYAAI|nr:hypothetical protein HPB50_010785 [Hyalomma asiaticum]
MAIVLSVIAVLVVLVAAAEATCYSPKERNGQCRRDPFKVPTLLFGTKTTYRHSTGLDSKRALPVNQPEDVRLLAKACAFEVAHHGSSPFCYLFDKEDLDLLEYAEDLDDYEKDAYGNQRNVALGCVIVEELVGKIREKLRGSLTGSASNQTRLTAALYFTHSVLLKILVATLGKGKAVPALRASNYCHYKDQRPWRSSYLVPFTANFALVLYECANSQLRLMSILNERAVLLPGCKELFCPLEDFLRSTVVRSSRHCDPEKICSKSWNESSYPA